MNSQPELRSLTGPHTGWGEQQWQRTSVCPRAFYPAFNCWLLRPTPGLCASLESPCPPLPAVAAAAKLEWGGYICLLGKDRESPSPDRSSHRDLSPATARPIMRPQPSMALWDERSKRLFTKQISSHSTGFGTPKSNYYPRSSPTTPLKSLLHMPTV